MNWRKLRKEKNQIKKKSTNNNKTHTHTHTLSTLNRQDKNNDNARTITFPAFANTSVFLSAAVAHRPHLRQLFLWCCSEKKVYIINSRLINSRFNFTPNEHNRLSSRFVFQAKQAAPMLKPTFINKTWSRSVMCKSYLKLQALVYDILLEEGARRCVCVCVVCSECGVISH